MRANEDDYEGFLQTDALELPGMPLKMVYRRDARLMKEQRRGLAQQVLLSKHPQGVDAGPRPPRGLAPRRELVRRA